MLTDVQNFCTAGKRMKFATNSTRYYPPHCRHVATLPWEIKKSNFLQRWKKTQTNRISIACNFVIHPQILMFSVFKIANLSPYWLQIKIFHVTVLLLIYFCDQYAASQIRNSITYITAVFVNNQHGIKWRGQDFGKMFVFEEVHSKEVGRRKAEQSKVLISCSKSCATQTLLTGGQAAADRAVHALKKTLSFFFRSSRNLPLTLFCRLWGEATENTFLSVKKTKSVAYCGTVGTSEAEAHRA